MSDYRADLVTAFKTVAPAAAGTASAYGLKDAPEVVSVQPMIFGMTSDEWAIIVSMATLGLIVAQMIYLAWKWRRDARAKA